MKRGRPFNAEVRDWIIKTIAASPAGLTAHELRALFRKSPIDFVPHNILKVCWQMSGVGKDFGRGQELHVGRWSKRSNSRGEVLVGGKLTPVFVLGPGENAEPPAPTADALKQKARRAAERAILHADAERRETERRRALKRQPTMDALTAALFGRPNPSRSK